MPSGEPAQHDDEATNPTKVKLVDADPSEFGDKGCVRYAQKRRPDLGEAVNGHAADYIDQFSTTFQLTDSDTDLARLHEGYALVWEPGQKGADDTHGHVAIIEKVEKDRVYISHAGWEGETGRWMSIEDLRDLHIIP